MSDMLKIRKSNAMNKLVIIATILMVTACTQVSEVIATGPNTYLISSAACPACGGSSKAVTLALQKASSFCVKQGKQMLRKNVTKENLNYAGAGGSSLEFRCLDPDHPEYIRADGARESDVIIEHR